MLAIYLAFQGVNSSILGLLCFSSSQLSELQSLHSFDSFFSFCFLSHSDKLNLPKIHDNKTQIQATNFHSENNLEATLSDDFILLNHHSAFLRVSTDSHHITQAKASSQ